MFEKLKNVPLSVIIEITWLATPLGVLIWIDPFHAAILFAITLVCIIAAVWEMSKK